jgi:hypothetical protein
MLSTDFTELYSCRYLDLKHSHVLLKEEESNVLTLALHGNCHVDVDFDFPETQ